MTIAAGVAAAAGVLLLAGCSGSSGFGNDGAADPGRTVFSDKGAAPAARPGAPAPGNESARGGGPAAAGSKTVLTPTALIQTADIVVEISHGADVAAKANRAAQLAIASGGSVFADDRTAGANPSAALTLKVPGPALVRVTDELAALGKELSRHSSSQDVTGQVVDVNSRVRSAQDSIAQWRLLLHQATKLGDIIALESQLSQREADLEALQAQQRSLASRTEMATLTLNLTASTPGAAGHQDKSGFLGGLERGWRTFVHAASAVATAAGAAVPFVGLGLLILGAAVLLRRRLRGSAAPIISPPDPA
ncbi:MAG: DUF4349 domain-containing protein [Jatrophihabitantaceae bacterium]